MAARGFPPIRKYFGGNILAEIPRSRRTRAAPCRYRIEHSDDETRIGDIAEVFATDNTCHSGNYGDDGLRHEKPEMKIAAPEHWQNRHIKLENCNHQTEVGQPIEVPTADHARKGRARHR